MSKIQQKSKCLKGMGFNSRFIRNFPSDGMGWASVVFTIIVYFNFANISSAKTLNVTVDGASGYSKIQYAINDAEDGDNIIIHPGIYQGDGNRDIDVSGKSITIRSTNPNDSDVVDSTVIDCRGSEETPHTGFYFQNNEDPNTVLSGFSIINGNGSDDFNGESVGGAIVCIGSSPMLAHLSIRGNTARYGGAMYFNDNSKAIVDHCIFQNNYAGYGGGAIFCATSEVKFTNCIIEDNEARIDGGGIYLMADNSLITHCTIRNNVAKDGGGVYFSKSNNTIQYSTITHNRANQAGGGLYCNRGNPVLLYSSITNNISNFYIESSFEGGQIGAGGGIYAYSSTLKLVGCSILKNDANGANGGGCYTTWGLSAVNCIFSGNKAYAGAGIHSSFTTDLTNCTFYDNFNSGKVYGNDYYEAFNQYPLYADNCIFWSSDKNSGIVNRIYLPSTKSYELFNCCVQGLTNINTELDSSNFDNDPLFIDADGPDGIAGTQDDNYRLRPNSPCLNTGKESELPLDIFDLDGDDDTEEVIPYDADLLPRLQPEGGVVVLDVGAFEGSRQGLLFNQDDVFVNENGESSFSVFLTKPPAFPIRLSLEFLNESDPDITLKENQVLIFDENNFFVPQPIIVKAKNDIDFTNGKATILLTPYLVSSSNNNQPLDFVGGISIMELDNDPIQEHLFVDKNAPGDQTGLNWENAFTCLQDAVVLAQDISEIKTISVAEGIYYPDKFDGQTSNSRFDTFRLRNNLIIKGGFAGYGNPDPDLWNPEIYESILSGDLSDNDCAIEDLDNASSVKCLQDNSLHIVTGSYTDSTSVLDGFVIQNGHANLGSGDISGYSHGGGLFIYKGSPTIKNCVFRFNYSWSGTITVNAEGSYPLLENCNFLENIADMGTGLTTKLGGSAIIIDCEFKDNYARQDGGAISADDVIEEIIIDSCIFTNNSSVDVGGAIKFRDIRATIKNSYFSNNEAVKGGAIYAFDHVANVKMYKCIFEANKAERGGAIYSACNFLIEGTEFINNVTSHSGGAIYHSREKLDLFNCKLTHNISEYFGGALFLYLVESSIKNCLISGNIAQSQGGGIYSQRNNISIESSTIVDNVSLEGGGIYFGDTPDRPRYKFDISNTILSNPEHDIWNPSTSNINIKFCNITKGESSTYDPGNMINWDVGNISAAPHFIKQGSWSSDPLVNIESEYDNGDFRLQSHSPCIDKGDPNRQTDTWEKDIDGNPRIFNNVIDMGASEFVIKGSVSIDSSPIKGDIYVNNEFIGTAPFNGELVIGQHDVGFSDVPWYITPSDQLITVFPNETTSLQAVYDPSGLVEVDSNMEFVEVFINEFSFGVTPLSFSLEEGDYTVQFEKISGYDNPEKESITVEHGQAINIAGIYHHLSPLNIKKIKIKADKNRFEPHDSISVLATLLDPNGLMSGLAEDVVIGLYSSEESKPIYTYMIPKEKIHVKNNVLKYADKNNVDQLVINLERKQLKFYDKNIDLSGLTDPVLIKIKIGEYRSSGLAFDSSPEVLLSGGVIPDVVNGKKPIPITLMMGVSDSLRVDKCALKLGTKKPSTDSIKISGGLALKNPDMSMAEDDIVIQWGSASFTLPAQDIIQKGTKRIYRYKKPKGTSGPVTSALFNLDKGTFKIKIKNASIDQPDGEMVFGLQFNTFDESVILPMTLKKTNSYQYP